MILHRTATIVACLSFLFTAGGAQATGGFSCEATDNTLEFDVSAAMSHGMGAAFLQPKGQLTVKVAKMPDDMKNFDLSQALVHHWIYDANLKLHYYMERQGDKPFANVELIVEAKVDGDAGEAKGDYTLLIFGVDPATNDSNTQTFKGQASCFVE